MANQLIRCFLLGFWLFGTSGNLFGQPIISVRPGHLPTNGLDIRQQVAFVEDDDVDFFPNQARPPTVFGRFPEGAALKVFLKKNVRNGWIRFTIGPVRELSSIILYAGPQPSLQLYRLKNGRLQLLEQAGSVLPKNHLSAITNSYKAVSLPLLPNQNNLFYLRIVSTRHYNSLPLTLFDPVVYRAFLYEQKSLEQPFFLFLIGTLSCLLLLACFWLFQYFTSPDKAYWWYGFYLLFTFAYLFRAEENVFSTGLILPNQPTVLLFAIPFLVVGMEYTYLRFICALLEVDESQKIIQMALRIWTIYFILIIIIWLLLLAFFDSYKVLAVYYTRTHLVLNLVNVVIILLIVRIIYVSRHPLRGYVLVGSLLLAMGFVGSIIISSFYRGWSTSLIYTNPAFYSGLGILLEVFCLSVALGRRTQLLKDEKKHTESVLATEQARFQQRIAETEMAALRSQMNPHFIFNCLNSIQFFTAQNDSEKASGYLSKFSRLIRLVLENSRSEKVTLDNELETLQLYFDMEAMRFPQKLHYRIDIDPQLDTGSVQIPPLLLQPFVENAIWHGLMHKEEGGTVLIDVHQPQDGILQIEITDDGIGREKAAEYKSKSATKQKSFGMKITADRINLINQLYQIQTNIVVTDLVDTQGQPAGTKVTLSIPI
ncbi:histidine kinase [Spirosoma sp. BT702]|uniref:Histidine kinase n=1 Tax=Spirosoma profusum TaxID=2771354 RepID=A0A926Y452_9BACT|nr:histidine kinase [Spirosoma profusum]MBD2702755.1 histidine kinase [Spirosoma profusum]